MHKALHPRDDVDRLYVLQEMRGGREFAWIEGSVDASIQRLEDYKDINEDLVELSEMILTTR